jgi:hypothetical protein
VVDDARPEAGVRTSTRRRRLDARCFQRRAGARLRQPRLAGERGRKPDIGAIAGDEHVRNLQRIQPLGERKRLFVDQPDIQQRKIRRVIGDHVERLRHACRGAHRLHTEAENRVLEVDRDDRIIFNDQDVTGQAVKSGGVHDLLARWFRGDCVPRQKPGARPAAGAPDKRADGSGTETTTSAF